MSALASPVRQLAAGFRVLLVLTVILGIAYPLAITGIGQVVSPGAANGSRVELHGRTIGSSLIAQPFTGAQWFQPRPSAAGDDGYDTLSSSASNLGPNNPDLVKTIDERKAAYAKANGVPVTQVPADAVTASGSGLDPDISPANARIQAVRVAKARGLDPGKVLALVAAHARGRALGILGDARVNVLELDLAVAAMSTE
ncbi:MAG: potassium-transporting ATPase subunit KdpC [Solirubrobacteraceae bacterium]|nr:potassium-transporting ATPase subunit KdpC [Patulibacter sp.]